jgi:hypothetical protein
VSIQKSTSRGFAIQGFTMTSSCLQSCSEEDQAKYFSLGLPREMAKAFDFTKASSGFGLSV